MIFRKKIFAVIFLASSLVSGGGILNKESKISPMTKVILAAIAAQQKIFEKNVDEYQKKLIDRQIVILGRIKQVSGVKVMVTRAYLENQSILHNLKKETRQLSLQISSAGLK